MQRQSVEKGAIGLAGGGTFFIKKGMPPSTLDKK